MAVVGRRRVSLHIQLLHMVLPFSDWGIAQRRLGIAVWCDGSRWFSFIFGMGMQLGGGCGSGTLFTVGGGSTRMVITLGRLHHGFI